MPDLLEIFTPCSELPSNISTMESIRDTSLNSDLNVISVSKCQQMIASKKKQGQLRQESNKGKTNQENTAATQTGSSDGFPILTLLEERGFPRQSLIADNLNHIFHYQANAWLCKFFWGVFH